jgi:hypothetical protein
MGEVTKMGQPTRLNVSVVNDLFFRHMKELSLRSLRQLKDGERRQDLSLYDIEAS